MEEVVRLFLYGTSWKLLAKGTSKAKKKLELALAILSGHDHTDPPWPHIIKYRMAHILMRTAKTEEELLQIDELFTEASKANSLGPLPRLYRIAVLNRLGADSTSRLKPIFEQLIKQIDGNIQRLDVDDNYQTGTEIQTSLFNMVEMASYFTGYPYSDLEGRGQIVDYERGNAPVSSLKQLIKNHNVLQHMGPFYDFNSKLGPWNIFGTPDNLTSISYPGEMVLEEMENRMLRGEIKPPCIAFRISEDRKHHHININLSKDEEGFFWNKLNFKSKEILYLLGATYYQDEIDKKNFIDKIHGNKPDTNAANLRKTKERCSESIYNGINPMGNIRYLKNEKVFFNSTSGQKFIPALNPKISILGAVDNDVLESHIQEW